MNRIAAVAMGAASLALAIAPSAVARHGDCRSGVGITTHESGRAPDAWVRLLDVGCGPDRVYIDHAE